MRYLLLLVFGLLPAILWAQPDSNTTNYVQDSVKTYHLDEVTVSNEAIDGSYSNKKAIGTSENIDFHLEKLEGVDLVKRGMYGAEPVYRGMSGERVPVTINNMKIFGACTDKMDPVSAYVSANNLQSIAIIKDAADGGSMNATSGVIALKTKTPVFNAKQKWSGQIGGSYKSVNNEISSQFSTAFNTTKWAMRANGIHRHAINYKAGGGKRIAHSQYQKNNFALSTSYLANKKTLLSAEYIYDLSKNIGYPALPMDVSVASGNIYSFSLFKYFAGSQLEAKIYGSNIFHEMDDSDRTVIMHMDMPGWSNTYGAYVNWNLGTDKSNWNATLDYYLNQSRAEMTMYPVGEIPMYMLTWPDVFKHSISMAVSNEHRISTIFKLSTSLRLEAGTNEIKDKFGTKQLQAISIHGVSGNRFLLPALSIKLNAKMGKYSQWNLMASYSQRQGSVTEGFGYYLYNIQDNYDYIGDPQLSPESSLKLETGFAIGRERLKLNLQVYSYYIPNYIIGEIRKDYSAMTIGATGVKFYVNLPFAYMYGFEAGIDVPISEILYFSSKAQVTLGYDSEDLPLPLIPPLKNTMRLTVEKNNWNTTTELRSALAQNNPRLAFGESETPGYAILSVNIGYKFTIHKTNVHLAMKAENLLDQYYWDHLDFNRIPRPGRSINFSLLLGWE